MGDGRVEVEKMERSGGVGNGRGEDGEDGEGGERENGRVEV